MSVSVGVVVPAYNAQADIGACLAGLAAAGFAPDVIHVVDDGSTDDTRALCRAAGVTPITSDRNLGAAGARNLGAARATEDILFFVDADVVVHADAKAVIAQFFTAHPDYDAFFGTYDAEPFAKGRVSRIRNLLHRQVHLEGAGDAVTFWTGCGAVRREAFARVGGFDPDQRMMEDIAFGMALTAAGGRIRLSPALQGCHRKHWRAWQMFRTDLFDRAIPWARLLTHPTGSIQPEVLNINASGRISVVLVAASLLGLMASLAGFGSGVAATGLALIGLAVTNRRFLTVLARGSHPGDAVAAVPVLWLHYLAGGLGFAWVRSGIDAWITRRRTATPPRTP